MHNGVTHGEARVRVSISATGQLLDALVIGCTHRDFGSEALRTVALWRFEPELVKSKPIGVVADIEFNFEVNGMIAIEKRSPAPNAELYAPIDPYTYKAEGLKSLDHIPTPTHVVPPVYPKEWSESGIVGSATVEFYIDESGKARIPVVTATDHSLLGASAVAAVSQWRFEPPTRGGKPVLVRAEQVFSFYPEKK
jgi:TonB family protein